MARGEEATPKRALGGLVAMGFVFACGMCVTTGVISMIYQRNPAPTREPFDGMSAAFAVLGVRDSSAVTTPAEARANAEAMLRDRGYVAVESAAPVSLLTLPAELDAQGLDGGCGVLLAVGDAATSVSRVVLPSRLTFSPHDPRVAAIPVCGRAHVRIEGAGSVALHTWLFPGVTEADVAALGLPVEVALAHAEAAHTLIPARLEATDELAVVHVASTSADVLPWSRRPTRGCVPFVAVSIGADALPTSWTEGRTSDGRSTTAGAFCATRGDALPSFNFAPGATIYVRTYREVAAPRPAGPAIGALHVVSETALALDETLPENAAP